MPFPSTLADAGALLFETVPIATDGAEVGILRLILYLSADVPDPVIEPVGVPPHASEVIAMPPVVVSKTGIGPVCPVAPAGPCGPLSLSVPVRT